MYFLFIPMDTCTVIVTDHVVYAVDIRFGAMSELGNTKEWEFILIDPLAVKVVCSNTDFILSVV
jgi:hypothetical protein